MVFINSCNIGYVSFSCVKLKPIIIIIVIIIICQLGQWKDPKG